MERIKVFGVPRQLFFFFGTPLHRKLQRNKPDKVPKMYLDDLSGDYCFIDDIL